MHERNAMLLAHHYQRPEVQEVADFVADSLRLSQTAAKTDADVIVLCGVHFMAETAAILCPDKTVLLPDLRAGCSLAAAVTADELRAWKARFPGRRGGGVHQYVGGGESGERLLLHVGECGESGAARFRPDEPILFSAGQIFGGGGGAANRPEQHHRVSRLLPRAQEHSSRRTWSSCWTSIRTSSCCCIRSAAA